MKRRDDINRRSYLRKNSLIAAGITTPMTVVRGNDLTPLPDEDAKRKLLSNRYGKEPAEATIRVLRKWYPRKKNGHISTSKYHTIVTNSLLNTKGRVVAEDVIKAEEQRDNFENQLLRNSVESGGHDHNDDVDTSEVTDPLLGFWEGDKNTSGLASANWDIHFIDGDVCDIHEVKATSAIYGSAWALVRFHSDFTPDSSGDYKFTIDYYRNGKAVSGGAKFSLYVIDSGAINKKVVESVSSTPDGEQSVYKVFTLGGGNEVTVGLETYCTTSTGGGGGYGDFYSDTYHVDPDNFLSIEKI